jgi:hypothetical protein
MENITIQITPIGQCNFMYPNSDNIIWFLQRHSPNTRIKNIIQTIHNFYGPNIVISYTILEYMPYQRYDLFIRDIITNGVKQYFFMKDIWEITLYTSDIDPRIGSFSSIKTYFISCSQTFSDIMDTQDQDIEKYLQRAKDEFRDYYTNKVVGLFSLN